MKNPFGPPKKKAPSNPPMSSLSPRSKTMRGLSTVPPKYSTSRAT
nr:MAG TPA: hypothetical protein [Caudoviricetes sp.]